jgi:hypothetical protein
MIPNWALLGAFALLLLMLIFFAAGRYSKIRSDFTSLAASLCDPGTWRVTFYVRAMVIAGKVEGHAVRFSTSGEGKSAKLVHSYLLLEHPVVSNFRFYAMSDVSLVQPELRSHVESVEAIPGFYALIVMSSDTPWPAKLLSRPLGLGYKSGILLCLLREPSLDADLLRQHFELLIDLAEHGA